MGKLWDWIKKQIPAIQMISNVANDKPILEGTEGDITATDENGNIITNPVDDFINEIKGQKEETGQRTTPEPTSKPQYPTIETPTIKTEEEEQTPINTQSIQSLIEEYQKNQWEREDKIRQETQAREDTAYQRAVEDMRNAGINPNLMNVSPASAGGGITSATGIDTSTLNTTISSETQKYINEMDRVLEEWITAINKDTTMTENSKNRWIEVLQSGLQALASYYMANQISASKIGKIK